MSTAASTNPLAPLLHKLAQLRRHLRRWVLVNGLSRVAIVLLAIIALDFGLDRLFEMDRPQRLVMLLLASAVVGFVLITRLLRPLLRQPTDDALCLQVERKHGLRGSLISALQLARLRDPAASGVSPAMVSDTIDQGLRTTSRIGFEQVLDKQSHHRNLTLLALATVCLLGVATSVISTKTMSVWFQRNLLLTDQPWPQDVHLLIEGLQEGQLRVPRGADWPITVAVAPQSRRLPEEVTLEIMSGDQVRFENLRPTDDPRRFNTLLKRVSQALRIRAVSGRSRTHWFDVRLVEYPALQEIRLEVTAPAYAGGKSETLSPEKAHAPLVEGSRLAIRGRATKPLAAARLVRLADSGQPAESSAWAMKLSDDVAFQLELPITLETAGRFAIELDDTEQIMRPGAAEPENLTNREAGKFTIRVRPDRAPKIKLRRGQIGRMVVPAARLPFKAEIQEEFGLTDIRLAYEWTHGDGGAAADPSKESGAVSKKNFADQLRDGRLSFSDILDLPELNLPEGAELTITIEADDNNDVSGPGTGKSGPLRFRVVSTEELRTDLLQRESVLREAVRSQQQRQIAILADSRDLLRISESGDGLEAKRFPAVARLQKQQKQLAANLVGIVERLSLIRAEIQNNRLDASDDTHRRRLTERVITPLQTLIDRRIPEAVRQLDAARRTIEEKPEFEDALAAAIELQDRIDRELTGVVDNMVQDVNFQLVLDLLRELEGSQQDVLKRAEEERRRLIQELLEKEGKAGNQPGEPND